MSVDDAVEHETEIRSSGRRTPLVLAGLVVVAVIALLLTGGDDGGDALPPAPTDGRAPSTPTSETLTTTSPPATVPVFGVAVTERGPLPFVGAVPPARDSSQARDRDLVPIGLPIATGGRVVVLTEALSLHVGAPGGSFRFAGCCWDELVPSTEPGHVWGRSGDEVSLIDLDDVDPPTTVSLDVGDADLLGPATFGIVSVDGQGTVRWHRPSFDDPAPVPLPDGRDPIAAGGPLVLTEGPAGGDGRRRLELWRVEDGRLWEAFDVPAGVDRPAVLAPDGSHVAVPVDGGWSIRNATTAFETGRLPVGLLPVWLGARRFGQLDEGRIRISDGEVIEPSFAVAALAWQSPLPPSAR